LQLGFAADVLQRAGDAADDGAVDQHHGHQHRIAQADAEHRQAGAHAMLLEARNAHALQEAT
jgi:hypothetical protein